MAIQFKPTIPPEGIRAVCISILKCQECGEYDGVMFQLNLKQFSIETITNAEKYCDDCYDKAYSDYMSNK